MPSHGSEPQRGPKGCGEVQSHVLAQTPLVSKADGPSKMEIIFQAASQAWQASGYQAEHMFATYVDDMFASKNGNGPEVPYTG